MKRYDHGFTLIEIVVVLVLVSIVATTVFTRSITTDQINLNAQTEVVKSHIRYAQSLAMKRSENWGIFGNSSEYWLFGPWVSPTEVSSNPVRLPGQNSNKISMSDLGLDINPPFIIYFDGYGRPIDFIGGPLVADLSITIEKLPDRTQSRSFVITAETGLVTTP
ncbi:hypothetical protein D1AOALGA4SA_2874 [Olavius algarvensis Delta 1 endosymbiont]|nr:hypothetical protein D1AOALGA4SA_2874 [Olavius algarvensis Delta 1 endosymbiont]